jgi:hypothetical protein
VALREDHKAKERHQDGQADHPESEIQGAAIHGVPGQVSFNVYFRTSRATRRWS